MKTWLKDNWFKAIIAFAILLIAFSLSYYFVIRPYINDRPYRACLKKIDPRADFKDVASKYKYCDSLK